MDIKSEGNILLENHKKLYKQLIEIPDKREIEYIEGIEEGVKVGKPRFKNPKYQWSMSLLVGLRDHLQNIWNFFDKYSYWFDDTLIPLLYTSERRVSKKSIIFLLEEDVWNTDEVYGKYLIDENQDEITISYSRRERKMKQITLKTNEESKIKEWIFIDAIRQIKNQFIFLWDKLETEIEVCIDEIFHKPSKFTLKPNYLKDQLDKTKEISKQWAEAGLLNLGRIIEHWLLNNLGMKSAPLFFDLIREAEIAGLIDKNEVKLLRDIRTSYNNLKHKTYYKIVTREVKIMIENFSNLFQS
ncbi:MAG: hypothetical protein V3V33_05430 [Candidatus Lokiarchaeia archaeon]